MTFPEYLLFIFIGIILGAVLGRRAMNWYWHNATVEQKDSTGYWLALVIVASYFGAKRFW